MAEREQRLEECWQQPFKAVHFYENGNAGAAFTNKSPHTEGVASLTSMKKKQGEKVPKKNISFCNYVLRLEASGLCRVCQIKSPTTLYSQNSKLHVCAPWAGMRSVEKTILSMFLWIMLHVNCGATKADLLNCGGELQAQLNDRVFGGCEVTNPCEGSPGERQK